MLALIKDNPVLNRTEIIGQFAEGGWVDLPDGSRVSPAVDGWSLRGYQLKVITPADPIPAGQMVVSSSLQMVDGSPKIVNALASVVLTTDVVDAERDRRMDAGFAFNGKVYQARERDILNIAGKAARATKAQIDGAREGDLQWATPGQNFAWIAADNSLTPMDAWMMVEFGQAADDFVTFMFMRGREIKDRIIAGEAFDFKEDSLWQPTPTA
ncbi:hypothetical protein J2T09_002367 [Neorhizobium huautlense]|uniref:DUF4376 domain-containing protein n=1 Tax=Neorhizobium huautlense TaxID=67774 RepID=A0ABT9PT24_9HYPH|nr:DUF4376 domain-containing protein [Neorhizobium huautlense]MDP9837615.1 hypothetical protein [Neorhizobium huautlense]